MKNALIIFLLICAAATISCKQTPDSSKVTAADVRNPVSANGIDPNVELPQCEVLAHEEGKDGKIYDFGVIIEGENVVHTFEVKNTGKANLIISSAVASCGCTVPTFSKEPIPQGETGKVQVAFSSSGRSGKQVKTVTLTTNAQPSAVVLTIMANVVVPI